MRMRDRALYASDLPALVEEVLRDLGLPVHTARPAAREVAAAVLERYSIPREDPILRPGRRAPRT